MPLTRRRVLRATLTGSGLFALQSMLPPWHLVLHFAHIQIWQF